uniref:Uncharacterized protein n=1 Tax=Pararge aegeria TaxID=116150 RepID=S4P6Q5_9NEOP
MFGTHFECLFVRNGDYYVFFVRCFWTYHQCPRLHALRSVALFIDRGFPLTMSWSSGVHRNLDQDMHKQVKWHKVAKSSSIDSYMKMLGYAELLCMYEVHATELEHLLSL